jgi:hypothetical protein
MKKRSERTRAGTIKLNMRTIYKYEIPVGGGEVILPNNAVILSAGAQGDALFLWAEVDSAENWQFPREIEVFGTGHPIPEDMGISRRFIGTAFMGPFVWHVYERG